MILDSSAVVAIVLDQPMGERLFERVLQEDGRRISAANLLESYMVVDRTDAPDAGMKVDFLLVRVSAQIEPVTHEQVIIARAAFHRYGKGSGHPARLNFGDCFAYALARFYNEPLLFVGRDFAATDVAPALPA